jgi:hypothetical protein
MAHGNLTLPGTTRAVTFTLTAERKGGHIEAAGNIPVLFFGLPHPEPELRGLRDHPAPRPARRHQGVSPEGPPCSNGHDVAP